METTESLQSTNTSAREPSDIPWRTILAVIGAVVATVVLLYVVAQTRRVLIWMVIAAFFAVALNPAVSFVQRRLLKGRRRAFATSLVFFLVAVVLLGVIALFIVPLAREGTKFADRLPTLIDQAREGHGTIGSLLKRTHALTFIQQHQDQIKSTASGLTKPAVGVLRGVATGVAGAITIFVLAFLMVLEGPRISTGVLALFPQDRAARIGRVASACAKSVTGYLAGNVAISVICGVLTFAMLEIMGVPFALLLALFVAIADLVPLVGATLGAVVAIIAAFIHSVPAGIVAIIFFIVYQQVENHLLQPVVFSRTVKLNPLTVLVAVLVFAQLAGILGALLAIPIASMIQIIARDVWDHRVGRLNAEPSVGAERAPAEGSSPATATAETGRPG
ncbi:MAG: hypothetical protein QOJ78_471 [Pseudonocardiales bacterium]|nr:hypothetical protein [Pseudonocardiales bacterium]